MEILFWVNAQVLVPFSVNLLSWSDATFVTVRLLPAELDPKFRTEVMSPATFRTENVCLECPDIVKVYVPVPPVMVVFSVCGPPNFKYLDAHGTFVIPL